MNQTDRILHVPLISALFGTLFLIVISFTMTGIASAYIVGDLGGDRSISTYALAFFGSGAAMTIPLAKPLAAKFGVDRIFVYCTIVFALASLLCAMAPTYFLFICARLFAGMASGPFYPLLAHFFSCLIPSQKKTAIIWTFITMLVVVPVIGASWGGTIAYLYNWRAPFFLNAAMGIVLSGIVRFYLREVKITAMPAGFDWMGWCFYALGIFCLSFAAATAQQLDWYRSMILVAAFLIGLLAFGYFFIRGLTHATPVLDLSLFAKPIFSLALLCLAILFAVYFGMIILLAVWLTLDVRFTPIWIAVLIGHMGIAGLFPRFIIEERMGRIDPRIWLAIATLLLAISCFYTTIFDIPINFGRIAFSRIVAGFGLALFLPPIFQILNQCYAPARWVDVFEIFQSIRNFACSLGASIFSILWQRRTVFYYERLHEKLDLQSKPTQDFFNTAKTLEVPGDPLAILGDLLDKQASSLALDDVFYLMGWILVGLLVLLLATFIFKRDAFNIFKARYTELT